MPDDPSQPPNRHRAAAEIAVARKGRAADVARALASNRASLAYDRVLFEAAGDAIRHSRAVLGASGITGTPASAIVSQEAGGPDHPSGPVPRPQCLLAEDEALIGMALEDALDDLGFGVLGPFMSCAEALHCLENQDGGAWPAVALLDLYLRDGPCTELALKLLGRGVPVVICSGHRQDGSGLPPELAGVRWIEKPIPETALREVLADLVPGHFTAPRPRP